MASSDIVQNQSKEMDLSFSTNLPASTLRNITSYADAFTLAREIAAANGKEAVLNAEDIGDGFVALSKDEKNKLVGKAFVMIAANLGHDTVTDRNYITCKVVTEDGQKYRFSDGSTGIFAQVMDIVKEQGGFVPMVCGNGLNKSEYVTVNEKGEPINATTYYIDTNAL